MQVRTQRKLDNYVGRLAIAALRPATKFLGLVLRRDHELTLGDEIVWMKMLGGGSLLVAMPMLLGFASPSAPQDGSDHNAWRSSFALPGVRRIPHH
jgi:hypothetical protein